MPRLFRAFAVPLGLVLAVALYPPAPAQAAILDVVCTPPSSDLVPTARR
ncbi:hypothetical protein [Spongiactinospora rosea]|nr:hypothetical protein [Spongiactinospora rosea]